MSPRRGGWDLAQIRTSFLSDPEFQRLTRACRNDRDFLAAVGLWTIALATAWRDDCDEVADVLASYPGFPKGQELLVAADLTHDGCLSGFAKWTETVRRVRAQDAARKRGESGNVQDPPADARGLQPTPLDSVGVRGTPRDFPRGVEVKVEDVKIPPLRADAHETDAAESWLAGHGALRGDLTGKLCASLTALVEAHGWPKVRAEFERLAKLGNRTARQFVFGAENALDAVDPGPRRPNGAGKPIPSPSWTEPGNDNARWGSDEPDFGGVAK